MSEIKELIEVELVQDYNVIVETLSRLGIANKKKKILFPTCYLYPSCEKYYIVHFKEMFLLTRPNGYNNMSMEDYGRKNSIIWNLIQWGLIKLPNNRDEFCIEPHDTFIYVLPFKEKAEWDIQHKFNMATVNFLN